MRPASAVVRREGDFATDGERLRYTWIGPEGQVHRRLLYLHGGGSGNRRRIFPLAEALAMRGVATFCFDFSGHGESSGRLVESSLERRCHQALAAHGCMGGKEPLVVMGNSMGAYVAAELLADVEVGHLILSCPALYVREAFRQPFDRRFTEVLRATIDFSDSRAIPVLRRYGGAVLLITAGQDNVIPAEVVEAYEAALLAARHKECLVFPEAPHRLHDWTAEKPERLNVLVERLAAFIAR